MRPHRTLTFVSYLTIPAVALSCGGGTPAGDVPDTTGVRTSAAAPEIGRIAADSFLLVLHDIERFTPPPEAIWKPAPGREYIALDVALHNPTADSIALGWSTIAPALVGADGTRYAFLPSFVAAFEMEAPRGARFDEAAYERLVGGRLAARDSVRAWAWAFEVPRGERLELEIVSEGGAERHRIALTR